MLVIGNVWKIGIAAAGYLMYTHIHSKFLYPLAGGEEATATAISKENNKRNANMYPNFQFVTDQIVHSLQDLFKDTDVSFLEKDTGVSSMITGAFSMALCCKLAYFTSRT